jgi:hypothetical protein
VRPLPHSKSSASRRYQLYIHYLRIPEGIRIPRQGSRIVVEWPPPFAATTLAATSSRPFHGLPRAFSGHVYARPSAASERHALASARQP